METMDRKEFLSLVGLGATALIFGTCLNGCNANDTVIAAPTNVDFTVDTATGELSKDGGYLYNGGVIVARVSVGNFIAVSQACTHEGNNVYYTTNGGGSFYCPSHGSSFSKDGTRTAGPARSSLAKYNTTLTGTSLRVYS